MKKLQTKNKQNQVSVMNQLCLYNLLGVSWRRINVLKNFLSLRNFDVLVKYLEVLILRFEIHNKQSWKLKEVVLNDKLTVVLLRKNIIDCLFCRLKNLFDYNR